MSPTHPRYAGKSVNRNEELRAAGLFDVHFHHGVLLDALSPIPSLAKTIPSPSEKSIALPPSYHPSVGGKFLASGPPPPPRNRPSTKPKSPITKSSLIKKSSYAVTKDMVRRLKCKKVKTATLPCNRPAWRPSPKLPDQMEFASSRPGTLWTQYEHEALYVLLVAQRNEEIQGDTSVVPLKDATLFTKMVAELEAHFGVERTSDSARVYWNRYGRQKSGWDERCGVEPGCSLVTSAQGSKAACDVAPKKVFKRLYQKRS
ncbi:uncharacterized protein RAG0_10332 [Rhynchosporium agropyri]|uniref:Uncharacterized protein n=1 Tax=Rhynchosporium agropyri TaxID=914238 RepID=A0A1E1KZD7_9HELO|nr:uncharacterized protein RAG0_10332 [Rhynchosporium agropyri]